MLFQDISANSTINFHKFSFCDIIILARTLYGISTSNRTSICFKRPTHIFQKLINLWLELKLNKLNFIAAMYICQYLIHCLVTAVFQGQKPEKASFLSLQNEQ